jgi:hypothetical protein
MNMSHCNTIVILEYNIILILYLVNYILDAIDMVKKLSINHFYGLSQFRCSFI